MIGIIIYIIYSVHKSNVEQDKKIEEEQKRKEEFERKIKMKEETEKEQQEEQEQLKQEEFLKDITINKIKKFIKNNTDLFNSLKYIFNTAKDLYRNNLWCWESLTLSDNEFGIELIYSINTNKFYIGYGDDHWSAYIDSCFSEYNLNFFSKTLEFKPRYVKTTIKNNLNYHALYSMLKELKENIEDILYYFKLYTED